RVRVIGTRTGSFQVAALRWEQRQAGVLEDGFDVLRHLAGQQLGHEQRLAGQRREQFLPLGGGQLLDADTDPVGLRLRALHARRHLALADVDVQYLAAAGIGPAARQAGADVEALQDFNPALRPPGRAELAALRLSLDAALGRAARFGTREK